MKGRSVGYYRNAREKRKKKHGEGEREMSMLVKKWKD
jgi:hypothetical protein